MFNTHLKQTGRTQRLIEEALRCESAGNAVIIVTESSAGADFIKKRIKDIRKDSKIEVCTPYDKSGFDWRTMSFFGTHPETVVLIDHYTIEVKFHKILEILHRFDK